MVISPQSFFVRNQTVERPVDIVAESCEKDLQRGIWIMKKISSYIWDYKFSYLGAIASLLIVGHAGYDGAAADGAGGG